MGLQENQARIHKFDKKEFQMSDQSTIKIRFAKDQRTHEQRAAKRGKHLETLKAGEAMRSEGEASQSSCVVWFQT